ncbi:MAG: hypothetical protein SO360_01830 [Bifidobacterium tsurumiense]|uniref:hypothetical protein n=1 Tax=Bifidobacterium tsurumiense TaxID=356829 RepID=UPI002A835DB4|nr:hypothetical protein [Bifidobacterium tsurumiense]MDY4677592.1 hypothetical protein [Bifidobacterium tsurumiense]
MSGVRPAFAEPEALAEWLGEPIESGSDDFKRASRCLRAASNLIRSHMRDSWLDADGNLREDVPEELADVTLACAGRFFTNPTAETQWSRQIDDSMDGGSRKVDEAGLFLTESEKRTLDQLIADRRTTVAGIGVIGTERGEAASLDMGSEWFDDNPFLFARLT